MTIDILETAFYPRVKNLTAQFAEAFYGKGR